MKQLLRTVVISVGIIAAGILPAVIVAPAHAQGLPEQAVCEGSGGTWNTKDNSCTTRNGRTVLGTLRDITSILFFLAGAIAVIMVIVGGIKYTTSQGDQAAIGSAKNTVMYALVGLVVTLMSYAIVNWVLDTLKA